jgi:hypothetical protein
MNESTKIRRGSRLMAVGAFLSVLVLILSACGGGDETLSPEAQFTAAAQTAAALPIQTAEPTFTTDPASMVATMASPTETAPLPPTAAIVSPTIDPAFGTPAGAPTVAGAAQPTVASPGGGAPAGPGPDNATYVADVTVPDDEVMGPGEIFEKVWRIRNTGTTTWSTDYTLTFIDGELMGAPNQVSLPNEVSPGEEVEVSVEMSAPETPGSYISYWKMSNADGQLFGFGTAGNEAIWVKIQVQGQSAAAQGIFAAGAAPAVAVASVVNQGVSVAAQVKFPPACG